MHYQQSIKNRVRALRIDGYSLGQIQKETQIAKSTISLWVKDIILSNKQLTELKIKNQIALQTGRIKAQKIKKNLRFEKIEKLLALGKEQVKELNEREVFLIGVALYWAEGFKSIHERRLGFCNSDPEMIIFYIKWLKESVNIKEKDITLRLTLNQVYKEKTKHLEKYWSKVTGIPLHQFTKPFYQNSIWKKQYNSENYHGVLRIHVQGSLDQLLLMRGWIEGLKSYA
ncbi:MAG TPA: hypothetical protein VLG12_08200 [Candidatus Saccharimonadales bacterium]|nr:hypothetical protein [Candidatus Saccharimonadales bacterium]